MTGSVSPGLRRLPRPARLDAHQTAIDPAMDDHQSGAISVAVRRALAGGFFVVRRRRGSVGDQNEESGTRSGCDNPGFMLGC